MQDVLKILSDSQIYITLGLTVVVIILLILLIWVIKSLNSVQRRYRKLMRGVNNKNLEELINGYLDKIDIVVENSNQVKEENDLVKKTLSTCVQKVSVMRYKAFEDVGSDLSFSIAFLDQNNDGVILTGIYGRNESTTYAKPIDKGMSRYELSSEEEQVLEDAKNK